MPTSANRVDLLLPGLLTVPNDYLSPELDAKTGSYKRLLTYAANQSVPLGTLEQQILNLFGQDMSKDYESAAGQLSAAAVGLASSGFYLRADPVHFQIDRDSAYLLPAQQLQLSAQQSKNLVVSLNQHLLQHQLRLHYLTPQAWLLESSAPIELATCPLENAALKNIQVLLPKGQNAGLWNALQTELQMLLHQHPANHERAAAGLTTINSVWFWGGGKLDAHGLQKNYTGIYADDNCLRGLAGIADMPLFETSEFNLEVIQPGGFYLYQNSCLQTAASAGPLPWQQQLLMLQQQLIEPLLLELKAGRLTEIRLYTDGYRFCLTNKQLLYFWKRSKILRHFFARD